MFWGAFREVLGRFWINSGGDLGAPRKENSVAGPEPDPAPREERQRRAGSAFSTAGNSLGSATDFPCYLFCFCDPSILSSFHVETSQIVGKFKKTPRFATGGVIDPRLLVAPMEIYMPRFVVSFYPRGPSGSRPDAAEPMLLGSVESFPPLRDPPRP